MKTILVNNFGGGMCNDIYAGGYGEFSSARNFDVFSYPNRLFPLPSMATDTTGTGIGNMILGSDGVPYGVGKNASNGVSLYKNAAGNAWTILSSSGAGGDPAPAYDFLVEYKRYGSKFILEATLDATHSIIAVDPVGNSDTDAASITGIAYIGQGFEHPKDKILYVPYQNSSETIIGKFDASSWTASVLTLPLRYKVMCLTNYGDYLAIPGTIFASAAVPGSSVNTSLVWLWDRSSTLPNEVLTWGNDSLHVLNNLNGVLIGVSKYESNDDCKLLIKGYAGGQIEVIKEISIPKQTTTSPTITINNRVNFIHRNKMYFSVDLAGGDTSPSIKGLWSVGKVNGRWVVNVERIASTDGTDASVIAATFKLDYLYTCHTAAGTLTYDGLTAAFATRYASPAYYESLVNPNMPEVDKMYKKQLTSVSAHYLPLPTAGQVVMKYKVDGGAWTTIFTETTDSEVATERTCLTDGTQFTAGRNYEFRLESTGFAQITGFTYTYEIMPTNI